MKHLVMLMTFLFVGSFAVNAQEDAPPPVEEVAPQDSKDTKQHKACSKDCKKACCAKGNEKGEKSCAKDGKSCKKDGDKSCCKKEGNKEGKSCAKDCKKACCSKEGKKEEHKGHDHSDPNHKH